MQARNSYTFKKLHNKLQRVQLNIEIDECYILVGKDSAAVLCDIKFYKENKLLHIQHIMFTFITSKQ